MSKRIILLSAGCAMFFWWGVAWAGLIVSEVMYDLDGADIDWVEIYNKDGDLDLTSLKLLISNSDSNHGIVKYSGSQVLHQGDYGVIVPTSQVLDFTSRWRGSGNIFTSSFSLPNLADGGIAKVELNAGDKLSPLASVTYSSSDGGNGDGNSLQIMGGSWVAGVPSPGVENTGAGASSEDNESGGNDDAEENEASIVSSSSGSSSGSSGTDEKTESVPNRTKIIVKEAVFAGVPAEFSAENTWGNEWCGKYFWNFGDGNFHDTGKISRLPQKYFHTYEYEGEYVATLDCFESYLSAEPVSSDRVIVKVAPADIVISRVGASDDFFVEVANNTSFEANLSGWSITSAWKKFIFPNSSMLKSKGKIILSPNITGFSIVDRDTLHLINSEGKIVYNLLPAVPVARRTASSSSLSKTSIPDKTELSVKSEEIVVPSENLLASAAETSREPENNLAFWLGSLLVFLAGGAALAYLVRRRGRVVPAGAEFEIVE